DRRRDGVTARHGQSGRAARRIAREEPCLGKASVADLTRGALCDKARDQPRRRCSRVLEPHQYRTRCRRAALRDKDRVWSALPRDRRKGGRAGGGALARRAIPGVARTVLTPEADAIID